MKVEILPIDIKTVKLIRNRKGANSLITTIPLDLIERKRLSEGEHVVIAFLCKSNEDIKVE